MLKQIFLIADFAKGFFFGKKHAPRGGCFLAGAIGNLLDLTFFRRPPSILEFPERQILEFPERQILEFPERQILEFPERQILEFPERQILEFAERQILE